jgi:hypothetical protein
MSLSIALRPHLIEDTGNRLKVLQTLRDILANIEGMVALLQSGRKLEGGIPQLAVWSAIQPILQGTYPGVTNAIMEAEMSLLVAHQAVLRASGPEIQPNSATWREAVGRLRAAVTALDELTLRVRTASSEHNQDMTEIGRSIAQED